MKHILALILLSLVISGCGILNANLLGDSLETDDISANEPPNLTLQGETSYEMDLSTYCWTNGGVGLCADGIPPNYEADSHILISSDTLELGFAHTPATSVSAFVHPGSSLMTRIADIQLEATVNDDGTVSIPLSEQLDGDYVLVVIALWQDESPSGDAFYTLPIRLETP